MNIVEMFAEGKFVISSEIGPPKGIDVHEMIEDAELIRDKVSFINVTDQQSSVMRLGPVVVSHLLKQKNMEPICQLTCRDRNRIALQSDILSAAVLGIENFLCLTGDYITLGDHHGAKPVFDLDSVSLLKAAVGLREGHDMVGEKLLGVPKLALGAVVTPDAEPMEPQLMKMEKKINAGAEFFQTQAVYDPKRFETFMKRVESFGVPIMLGIVLLKSAGMAKYMNANVAGVQVPEPLIKEMADTKKGKERIDKSIEIGARLIREMKDMCQGVHIMPLGWDKHVPALLEQSEL